MPLFLLLFIICSQLLYMQALPNTPSEPLKILCLGDSITEGPEELGLYNYRYELWKKLVDSELAFDFLGTVKESREYDDYKGKTFDPHNQGHSGWTSAEVNDRMEVWLGVYTPDVVLLHLGTNDFRKELEHDVFVQVGEALFQLNEIIEKLQKANPNVVIYLAQIIPRSSSFDEIYEEFTLAFNESLEAFENKTDSLKGSVFIVDHHSDFEDDDLLEEGTHPNQKGVEKMADTWYDALLPFLKQEKRERIKVIEEKDLSEKKDTLSKEE